MNERFATAADKLGNDKPPAVRLAGVYAMAGLADDWEENRQTCVDVLCAYLRLPYEPDPGDEAPVRERLDFRASREVRHTVIRVIGAHLRQGATVSWRSLDYDFTSVVFDGGDVSRVEFFGRVSFRRAEFSGGQVSFEGAAFSGGEVSFERAKFSGGEVSFEGAMFSGGEVSFRHAEFSSRVSFNDAAFSGGRVSFGRAAFSGGQVSFGGAAFSGSQVSFRGGKFSGGEVWFGAAEFSGGEVSFGGAAFSGGEVSFGGAAFSGGRVSFGSARFSGGTVDFSQPTDWAHPPEFDWDGTPPSGVMLPGQADASHLPEPLKEPHSPPSAGP